MYLATNPSQRATVSATLRWYAPMISRRSSGSKRDAKRHPIVRRKFGQGKPWRRKAPPRLFGCLYVLTLD
jgi:hypothetical protein